MTARAVVEMRAHRASRIAVPSTCPASTRAGPPKSASDDQTALGLSELRLQPAIGRGSAPASRQPCAAPAPPGSAPTTSASPPVLTSGTHSEATDRTRPGIVSRLRRMDIPAPGLIPAPGRHQAFSIGWVISTMPLSVRRNHFASSTGSCPTTSPSGITTPAVDRPLRQLGLAADVDIGQRHDLIEDRIGMGPDPGEEQRIAAPPSPRRCSRPRPARRPPSRAGPPRHG